MNEPHIPVLLSEVLTYLKPVWGGVYVDGTFGAGGYTQAILEASPNTQVIAFDRDPSVIPTATFFLEKYQNRFSFIPDCFGSMKQYIERPVDGIVLDLGVSSMQIDDGSRGFSLRFDGPLDMRMSQDGLSAAEVVNTFPISKLADILFRYGEEKASYRIARAIDLERKKHPIETTSKLAHIIHQVMPKPKDGSDSATRSFQALRIFVNNELGELEQALQNSPTLLNQNGRLVVVSFHSLEDRIVKNFMIDHSDLKPNVNRHQPEMQAFQSPIFRILTKKPIVPSFDELNQNPRAHSAKLRAAQKISEGAE